MYKMWSLPSRSLQSCGEDQVDKKILQETCHQYVTMLGNFQSVFHMHYRTTWQTAEISTRSCEFREGTFLPGSEFPKGLPGPGLCIAQLGGGEGAWKGGYSGLEGMAFTPHNLV